MIVDGESRSAGAVVTNAKYRRVWRPIVTVMLGVIDMFTHGLCLLSFQNPVAPIEPARPSRKSRVKARAERASQGRERPALRRGRSEAESLDGVRGEPEQSEGVMVGRAPRVFGVS